MLDIEERRFHIYLIWRHIENYPKFITMANSCQLVLLIYNYKDYIIGLDLGLLLNRKALVVRWLTYSPCKPGVISLVHVRNLHPGCIFGHVNGALIILHPGANLLLHMNANSIISIHLNGRFR